MKPTQAEIRTRFDYRSDGTLLRKVQKIGAPEKVGGVDSQGYIRIRMDEHRFLAHRLVYAYHTGCWPDQIDHINGVRSDNRIENLREATSRQNAINRKVRTGSTGITQGLCWYKPRQKWRIQISVGGKIHHAGYYHDVELAELVAQELREKYFGEYSRGGKKCWNERLSNTWFGVWKQS